MFVGVLRFYRKRDFCRVEKIFFCNRLFDSNFCFWGRENGGGEWPIFARTGSIRFKKWQKPWKNEESAQRMTEGNPARSLVCVIQILIKFFLYRQIAFADYLPCPVPLPRVFEQHQPCTNTLKTLRILIVGCRNVRTETIPCAARSEATNSYFQGLR